MAVGYTVRESKAVVPRGHKTNLRGLESIDRTGTQT